MLRALGHTRCRGGVGPWSAVTVKLWNLSAVTWRADFRSKVLGGAPRPAQFGHDNGGGDRWTQAPAIPDRPDSSLPCRRGTRAPILAVTEWSVRVLLGRPPHSAIGREPERLVGLPGDVMPRSWSF